MGELRGQGTSRCGGVSMPATPLTGSRTRDNPTAHGFSLASGGMEGEMRRGGQPWRGRRSSLHGHHQVPGTSCSWNGAFPFPGLLVSSSQPPPSGSHYPGSFLHPGPAPSTLFSLFIYSSLSDPGPAIPHQYGLRGLLPSCHVCPPCASVPFPLQFSKGCKCNLTLVFIWRDQPTVDNNSSRPSLATELHVLKWEVGCWVFLKLVIFKLDERATSG